MRTRLGPLMLPGRWLVPVLLGVGALGLLGAVVGGLPEILDRTAVSVRTPAAAPLSRRVVVVIAGSLRRDAVEDPALMPHLGQARQRGGYGIAETAAIPLSVSLVRALTLGRPFSVLDIIRDFHPYRAPATSLVHEAHSRARRTCLVGPSHLTSPFAGVARVAEVRLRPLRDLESEDDEALAHALAGLDRRDCDLLVVYLGGLDKAGHAHGGMSGPYRDRARWLDGAVSRLETRAEAGTTFLVVSDHGTNDIGDHAVPERIVREAPLVAWGPGIVTASRFALRQIDLAPFLAALLGLPPPAESVGTVPIEALDGGAASRSEILDAAVAQKLAYVEAYGRRHGRTLLLASPAGSIPWLRAADAALHADLEQRRRVLAVAGTAVGVLIFWLFTIGTVQGFSTSASARWWVPLATLPVALAAAVPLVAPDVARSLTLPPFRPSTLFHRPVASLGGAVVALGLAALALIVVRVGLSLAVPVAALALAMLATTIHDALHWAAVAAVLAVAGVVAMRKARREAAVIAVGGLLAVLLVRRLRGLALTGPAWPWLPEIVALAALPMLWVAWTAVTRAAECRAEEMRRIRPGLAALGLFVVAVRVFDVPLGARWFHPTVLALAVVIAVMGRAPRPAPLVLLGIAVSSGYLLFDAYAFLVLTVAVAALAPLTRAGIQLGVHAPAILGGLGFGSAWLLFFATGNEFDLTAINSLRRGLLGSDLGGFDTLSIPWTVALLLVKLAVLHALPMVVMDLVTAGRGIDRGRIYAVTGLLHFALLFGVFTWLPTIGEAQVGAILLAAVSGLVYAGLVTIHGAVRPVARRVVGTEAASAGAA